MNLHLRVGGERRRSSLSPLLINLGVAAAHTAWSGSQEIGPVDWIGGLQQWLLGAHDPRLSVVLCFGVSFVLLTVLTDAWARSRARRGALAGPPARRSRPRPGCLVGLWVALMLLTWVLGLGAWAWEHRPSRFAPGADADFVPTLAAASAPKARYLALSGQVRADRVMEHREDGEHKGYLVPVLAPEPAPLRYALRMSEMPLPHSEPTVLRVEVLGPLPASAAAAWASAGHAVGDDALLLAPVQAGPSRAQREARARSELQAVVIVCALVGAGFTFALLLLALVRRRRRGHRPF